MEARASEEPTASPSGPSWVVSKNEWLLRISSTMFCIVSVMLCVNLPEDSIDTVTVLLRMIISKGDIREKPQGKHLSQFATDIAFCAVEAGLTVLLGKVITDNRKEHLRQAQVNGYIDSNDRNKSDSRVIKSLGQNCGNSFVNGFSNFIASFLLHTLPGSRTRQRGS